MPRPALKSIILRGSIGLLCLWGLLLFSACSPSSNEEADRLNERSYGFHYRSLDSTRACAWRALQLSRRIRYGEGEAEALNNLAFVDIVHMDYNRADSLLERAIEATDNQVELFVADIQLMRLCQRQSRNKDFYDYRERAQRRLRRIEEDEGDLNAHQQRRMVYAFSEYHIVLSTYLYYMGLKDQSVEALDQIDPNGAIVQDTAQTLNYLYNVGAGGIVTQGSAAEINQQEFDYLLRCYLMSIQYHYPYWEANSLQAMSEHLQNAASRSRIIRDNLPAMKFINVDQVPDSLLAGNLAERAMGIFMRYGDVYQLAGAYRTLAECYWNLADYPSAIYCLNTALLRDTVIERAPDLVASIREQLSLAYSAIDDKAASDYNRNIYLDMQEKTRQDRLLEARAGQLDRSSQQLNLMIVAVVVMIFLVVFLLFFFARLRRRTDRRFSANSLLGPLERWNDHMREVESENESRREEINEQTAIERMHVSRGKRANLEQRAKVQLVNSITPFIDRIINELDRMDSGGNQQERYEYIAELTDKINEYNAVLTQWIQLRQGQLSLHIESFPLQDLFDIVGKARMGFELKGVRLDIASTTSVVKADKTLTLFMINTLADNARKFTPEGGTVRIDATETDRYVEISVADTGVGMDETEVAHVFDHKPITDLSSTGMPPSRPSSHGFGLMNCKGIIDRYRKVSRIFSVCSIDAESRPGKGSRFSFRLPKGIARLLAAVVLLLSGFPLPSMAARAASLAANPVQEAGRQARRCADSCYQSNIAGTYERTLLFADSTRHYLNQQYWLLYPDSTWCLKAMEPSNALPAEIVWFRDSVHVDYQVILSMRNESAVAALALHRWDVYRYNNAVYTRLYRETTADSTLGTYVRVMQKSEANKNVAIAMLVILLLCVFPAYYMLYYRHVLYYRFCVDRIARINDTLLSHATAEAKLHEVDRIWKNGPRIMTDRLSSLNAIVGQVKEALRKSIDESRQQMTGIELAQDELHRVQLEDDRLHISNNVLDNCLSTLKHETMYYPSRIKQLIDGTNGHLQAMREVVSYYKELYSILSAQAMRAIAWQPHVDFEMLDYMEEILARNGEGSEDGVRPVATDPSYVRIRYLMPGLRLSDGEARDLFTPLTVNLQFLLCRQIVRELGEATNRRASGIEAHRDETGCVVIDVVMPKKVYDIWKSSK